MVQHSIPVYPNAFINTTNDAKTGLTMKDAADVSVKNRNHIQQTQNISTNNCNIVYDSNTIPRQTSLSRLDIRRKSRRFLQTPPFMYGLKNCGNSCYVNAIVHCLCHTEQISGYILRKTYEVDMKNIKNILDTNYLSSLSVNQYTNNYNIKSQQQFKITKAFVHIFQALWNNNNNCTSKLSYEFKTLIGNLNKQYLDNEQNDAQEFLLWFINTIHDELNLAKVQNKNKQTKNSSSAAISSFNDDLAKKSWNDYIDLNQSVITSTFCAQLHSTLRCNQCKEESKTFEPYLCVSLPIPQKIVKAVFVTVVFLNQSPKQLQIGLCLPITNTVKDVRQAIAQHSNLEPNDLALAEIKPNGFSQLFFDPEPMSRLNQDVYAIQFQSQTIQQLSKIDNSIPSPSPVPVIQPSPSPINTSYVNLLVLNRIRYKSGRVIPFGAPISVHVPRESNYRTLQLSIIKAQRSNIKDEAMEYAQNFVLFELYLIDQYQQTRGNVITEYPISHGVEWPLYLEKIVEILDASSISFAGPSHLQIYANWDEKHINQFVVKFDDKPDIHNSVQQAKLLLTPSPSASITLADCFSLFTQEEILNYDNAWYCTNCRRKENGTIKHLSIWTTPPILIIHLKRFCQTKLSSSKITYPIHFPLINLDVGKFLSKKRKQPLMNNENDSGGEENEDRINDDDETDETDLSVYDLFAVCNHRGHMSGGHYTAYCKNPCTDKWYCYDDHLCYEISEDKVCTPDAYILFYRRRNADFQQTDDYERTDEQNLISLSTDNTKLPTDVAEVLPLQQLKINQDDCDAEGVKHQQPKNSYRQIVLAVPSSSLSESSYLLKSPSSCPQKFVSSYTDQQQQIHSNHNYLSLSDTEKSETRKSCPLPRSCISSPTNNVLYPSNRKIDTTVIEYVYPQSSSASSTGEYCQRELDEYSQQQNQKHEQIDQNTNPWSRYNSRRYSNEDRECNVIYPKLHHPIPTMRTLH
ncbi:unnamed protein product [Didymodactylos carnosus]|uniref:ubiquitinyl hydrolase 1 n=1 Tax=Didymodactylos carnosus TaxID=1234261 RepID=A0A814CRC5_9BILA|nr:unnamed protein product [Didymodactylos carnosus]CAF0948086.1 unnamed protein product [Didymodactylos carnosus]CAF3684791.1 unnamed protein product [Didymodactylos carnosus]CAF3724071.1 unnamed protein product [Didymodactylos carnosus]